jgi:hypothetical protein
MLLVGAMTFILKQKKRIAVKNAPSVWLVNFNGIYIYQSKTSLSYSLKESLKSNWVSVLWMYGTSIFGAL